MATAMLLVDVQRNMLEGAGAVSGADAVRARLERLLEVATLDGSRPAAGIVREVESELGAAGVAVVSLDELGAAAATW